MCCTCNSIGMRVIWVFRSWKFGAIRWYVNRFSIAIERVGETLKRRGAVWIISLSNCPSILFALYFQWYAKTWCNVLLTVNVFPLSVGGSSNERVCLCYCSLWFVLVHSNCGFSPSKYGSHIVHTCVERGSKRENGKCLLKLKLFETLIWYVFRL